MRAHACYVNISGNKISGIYLPPLQHAQEFSKQVERRKVEGKALMKLDVAPQVVAAFPTGQYCFYRSSDHYSCVFMHVVFVWACV